MAYENSPNDQGSSRKRRRLSSGDSRSPEKTNNTRRKTACQACRLRKIKCDAVRPTCGICLASDAVCKYTDPLPEKLTIDSATDLLSGKLDRLQDDIGRLQILFRQSTNGTSSNVPVIISTPTHLDQTGPDGPAALTASRLNRREDSSSFSDHPSQSAANYTVEPSKDFLAIPAARTTCDRVLTWPVFEGKYRDNALIDILFVPPENQSPGDPSRDIFLVPGGLLSPAEESVPLLVDRFLENVHTKNPVLDVEELVRQSRLVAVNGLGWDAWSCLVLLASALGTIAKPFEAAVNVVPRSTARTSTETTWITDAPTTPRELQQAETYFVLACRRMGTLKHSILGSHCNFFAGVYLMYTLRPLLSWQYFIQSSVLYQLHMKTMHRLATDISSLGQIPVQHGDVPDSKQRRLEESMYWSCFKSESEFRVELPLPQTELATYYHPQMFPSPPSPVELEKGQVAVESPVLTTTLSGENGLLLTRTASNLSEASSLRQHAKQLCNEEESWYYYLTEIALRRIGNRIINTFFRQDPIAWLNIKPWLSIALEFDTQVSAWSAHLPAAMQHWETNYTIRAPMQKSLPDDGASSHVSRELSWATDNRLLEMRSWLYQPFLYYFLHNSRIPRQQRSQRSSTTTTTPPSPTTADATLPTLDSFLASLTLWSTDLATEDAALLYHFITSGIECNVKVLDVRSLRHRHHGLWYDMRSLMCASLILLAIVKSGYEAWIPGGAGMLWGYGEDGEGGDGEERIMGRIGHIIDEFDYWANESPDLRRHRDVLVEVTEGVRGSWREGRGREGV